MRGNAGKHAEYHPQPALLPAPDGRFTRCHSTGYIGRLCRCLLCPPRSADPAAGLNNSYKKPLQQECYMSFFIPAAYAQAAPGAAAPGSDMMGILMLVGFVVIFYLMIWRPQAKRAKEHKNLLAGLQKGDEV